MIRSFGDFELDDSLRKLSREGRRVRLTGQALDLLCFLVQRSGELITREDIKRQLWPGSRVEVEHSIDVLINRLRSALGDSGKSPRYIETIPRKGYRFLGPVNSETGRKNGTALHKWARRLGTLCRHRDSRSHCCPADCASALRQICSTAPFIDPLSSKREVRRAGYHLPSNSMCGAQKDPHKIQIRA